MLKAILDPAFAVAMAAIFFTAMIVAFCVLAGVALGGWLVYRTKREAHEGLFGRTTPKGEVAQLQQDFDQEPVGRLHPRFDPRPIDDTVEPPSEVISQQNERFLEQLNMSLATPRKET